MMLFVPSCFTAHYLLKLNKRNCVIVKHGKECIWKSKWKWIWKWKWEWRFNSTMVMEGNNLDKRNEALRKHLKVKYNIDSDLLNTNLKIKSGKKNIYEISTIWCNFFKCDNSFFNVVNNYLKTGEIDMYLHRFLSCDNFDVELNKKEQIEQKNEPINKNKNKNKNEYKNEHKSKDKDTEEEKEKEEKEETKNEEEKKYDIQLEKKYNKSYKESVIEEHVNYLLVYLMTFFYKNIRDFKTFSLLTEKLNFLLNTLPQNYQNQQFLLSICEVYNYLHVMNDELFTLIFDKLHNMFSICISENRDPIEECKIINGKEESDKENKKENDKENKKENKKEKSERKNKKLLLKDDELILILRTLYIQKYKNHKIVDFIIHYLKNGTDPHLNSNLNVNLNLNSNILIDVFFYLSLLNRLDASLLKILESQIFSVGRETSLNNKKEHFYKSVKKEEMRGIEKREEHSFENNNSNRDYKLIEYTKDDLKDDLKDDSNDNSNDDSKEMDITQKWNITTKIDLTANCCSKLLYAYFLLEENHINWFFIDTLLTVLCKNITDDNIFKEEKKMHERICIIRSYLRYKKRDFYKSLEKSIRKKLKEIYYFDIGSEKKINERKFVDKMSWHLKKLRIPHLKNIYNKGIVFDIIEKDQKLVWLCFSYHNYYVRTIDLTVEKKLQMEIIKSMKYKIAKTHYYQFSRMKARKTRFEYIRMCRYYSLRDRRNFDEMELEGWSLPYINWYHKKNKNVHVSNYFYNYKPLSEVTY